MEKETLNKANNKLLTLRILFLIGILILINILATRFHKGLDLTAEKRFTLSNSSKNLLQKLNDVVVVDVLLKGDNFPPGFQRLQESVRERLQTIKEHSNAKFLFHFVDPFEGKTEKEKGAVFQTLAEKGINGVNIQRNTDNDYSEKIVFPYAIVHYKSRECAVKLLENNQGMNAYQNLTNSESLLEYKFLNAITKLEQPDKKRIAYIIGNGEQLGYTTFDALKTLESLYYVDTVDINNVFYIPSAYSAIIICKPTETFSEKTKFKLDQYIMNGGKALWMIDQMHAGMDSLQHSEQFIATSYNLGLDDQLFKYGVRINQNLIEDMSCNSIPVTVGMNGDQPQMELRPWMYYPIIVPSAHHPIVNNMDALMSEFASSIDTINNPAIKKTILLESSKYSRVAAAPVRVSLSMLRYPLKPAMFNKPFQPIAALLEGDFESVFENRLPIDFLHILKDSLKKEFQSKSVKPTKMIVVSDGDLMLNDFVPNRGPAEMGYWKFTDARFSNKNFLLNCIEYLTDQSGILDTRSKDLRLRLLDQGKVKDEKTKWQFINIALPLLSVLIFASVFLFFRKRKYEGDKA